MPNVSFFINFLGKHVIYEQLNHPELSELSGIIMLNYQNSLPKDYLFIGTPDIARDMISKITPNHFFTFFVTEGTEDFSMVSIPSNLNLIATDYPMAELYNRINLLVCNYRFWSTRLMRALCETHDINQLIQVASSMIQAPIYLLDSGYRVLYGNQVSYFENNYDTELRESRFLSLTSIQSLFVTARKKRIQNFIIYSNQDSDKDFSYYSCEILYNKTTIAHLLIITNSTHSAIDISDLSYEFSKILRQNLLQQNGDSIRQVDLFSVFYEDLMNDSMSTTSNIENRVKLLPHSLCGYMYSITIRFEASGECPPCSYLLEQLKSIFPDSNITSYQQDICILYCETEQNYGSLTFDYDRLESLMEQNHAYAGISNGTRRLSKLRTLCMISSETIRLALMLRRNVGYKRIFSYEDYSLYYSIDLSVQHFIQIHGHNDIVYLAHPSIIALCRYDSAHKTNLRDVLFYYLLNDRSILRTAKVMYMHRNTVQNKLNKISEIISIPLDDGYIQHRMIYSCLLMKYYENYMEQNINLK